MTISTERLHALAQFARWAITESAFAGHDLDGAEVQAEAERLGLIKATVYDPERHGPSDAAEPGMDWYEFTAYLQHAGEAEPVTSLEAEVRAQCQIIRDDGQDEAEIAENVLVAMIAAPHPHQAPEGMVLVPREPTHEMVRASLRLDLSYMQGHAGDDRRAVYRAMIAASPSNQASASADQGGEGWANLCKLSKLSRPG